MTPKGPEIHADAPNAAEVANKFNENSEQEKYFAKEKVGLQTELGLAKQERTIGLSTVEEDTHNDADDLAESSDTEYQNILTSLPNQLQDINKQLRFTARKGKTREIRHIAREYRREFVKDMKYTCKTLGIYFRKLKNGRFDENMITPEQMAILNAKTQARHEKIKGFIGDTLTGDNMFAERGNKKDVFVGPDMKTSTDGVEVRGVSCTPAEAEAAMGRCQGGGSLAKQERCKFVEEKTGIRQNLDKFLTPTGSNIVTGAVKMIPTIVQIRGGVKAVKAGFSLIFGKGGEAEWKNLAIGTAMFGAVTFLDPTKSYETLKNTFGDFFAKGKNGSSSTAIDNKSIRNEIIEGSASTEKIRDEYAPQLIGKALAGLTMGEVKELGIIKYSGEKPVGINFDILKGHYRKKIAGGDNRKDLYAELLRDTKYLEDVMKAKPNDNIIEHGFDGTGLGKDAFEAPDNKDILVGTYVSHTLKAGGIVVEYFEQKGLEDKIMQSPTMKEYITTYGTDKFMKEIMKLPQEIREQIYAGDITFEMKDGKLVMKANNQDMILDIQKLSLATLGSTGLSESSLHFTSLSDLLIGANFTAKIINEHKSNYMIDHPFFYKQGMGEWGNDMAVSQGTKDRKNPFTRFHGKNSEVIDGGRYTSLDNTCPTIYNHMEMYTSYMNNLNIRKNAGADNYIRDALLPQLRLQYPGLSDKEYADMTKTYFGFYATRGNIDALTYQNRHAVKDPLTIFVRDSYNNTKNFIKPHYETIKQRTTERTEKGWNKIQNNATDIYNDAGDLKTRIASKRDSRDTVLRGLVKESGIALDKVENLTFNQLPQEIGNLIANIILGAGRIVYHTGTGVVEGIRGPEKKTNVTSNKTGGTKTPTTTNTKNNTTTNPSTTANTKSTSNTKKNPRDKR